MLLAFLATAVQAQEPPPTSLRVLTSERFDAQNAHLKRVGAWGAANLVAGSAVLMFGRQPEVRAVALQSAIWGGMNLGIAAFGAASDTGAPDTSLKEAIRAEDRLGNVLLLNLGLNTGYMLVGGTLIAVAPGTSENAGRWRAHGAAIVVQGAALLVLDGIAYAGSRRRQLALAESVAWSTDGRSVRVAIRL